MAVRTSGPVLLATTFVVALVAGGLSYAGWAGARSGGAAGGASLWSAAAAAAVLVLVAASVSVRRGAARRPIDVGILVGAAGALGASSVSWAIVLTDDASAWLISVFVTALSLIVGLGAGIAGALMARRGSRPARREPEDA
ncbi:MAG: hypothetical protein V4510_11750 [bacterium]